MKKSRILMIAALFIMSSFVFSENQKESDAKVIFLVGKVTVNKKTIKSGALVKNGDLIETGKGSKVQILLGAKSIIALSPESKLIYNITGVNREIVLEQGAFGAVLNKGEEKKSYVVRTPALTAGVRGTSFFAEAMSTSKSYFCVCNGVIRLSPENEIDKGEDVKAAHHAARYFTKEADGKISIQNGGLYHHDDKSLEALARAIQIKIDWTKPAE